MSAILLNKIEHFESIHFIIIIESSHWVHVGNPGILYYVIS